MKKGTKQLVQVTIFSLVFSMSFVGYAISQSAGNSETMTINLPQGNAKAGKQAFQDLLCTSCHRVQGESSFPKPVTGYEGPILGAGKSQQNDSDLATSIINPSHKISPDIQERIRSSKSPMTDYSDAITVRQLVDIVAYLQSVK
jgi:hypothetical protein